MQNSNRIALGLVFVAAAVLFVVLLPWLLNFARTPFSNDPEYWGFFGTYVGGVAGPAVALIALYGAAYTLRQQAFVNRSIQAQSLLPVLDSFDKHLEERLKKISLSIVSESGAEEVRANVFEVLSEYRFDPVLADVIPHASEIEEEMQSGKIIVYTDARMPIIEGCYEAVGALRLMQQVAERHEEFAGNNAVKLFYDRKYETMHKRLVARGYVSDEAAS